MKRLALYIAAAVIAMQAASAQAPRQEGPGRQDRQVSAKERIERKVDAMKDRLNLTEEQAQELTSLLQKQFDAREKAMESHRAEMKKIDGKYNDGLAKILTPEQMAAIDRIPLGPKHQMGHKPGGHKTPMHHHRRPDGPKEPGCGHHNCRCCKCR